MRGGFRSGKIREGEWLCLRGQLTLSDSEDGGSAVGAYAFDRSLSVLERDVRWVLYLDVCFAFDAVCLWHFYSAERALERGSI